MESVGQRLPLILQLFVLDEKAFTARVEQAQALNHSFPEKGTGRMLVTELHQRGYRFYEGATHIGSVPTSFVVGISHSLVRSGRCNIQAEVGRITEELGLPYRSGEVYLEHNHEMVFYSGAAL